MISIIMHHHGGCPLMSVIHFVADSSLRQLYKGSASQLCPILQGTCSLVCYRTDANGVCLLYLLQFEREKRAAPAHITVQRVSSGS